MKRIRRDRMGGVSLDDVIVSLILCIIVLFAAILTGLVLMQETAPLTVNLTNTSDESLSFELYVEGVYTLNGTIEPKSMWTWDYKNGFWGPGETTITVKLPNTLFEKEGWGSHTISFIFE